MSLLEWELLNICYACCVCVKANRLTSPRAGRHSRASSDTCSFSGRLLTISPAEELTFIADETGKEIFDIITLTNTLMYPIAFKVRLCWKVVSHCVLSCVSLVQFSSVQFSDALFILQGVISSEFLCPSGENNSSREIQSPSQHRSCEAW